jgi:hypothetical protein
VRDQLLVATVDLLSHAVAVHERQLEERAGRKRYFEPRIGICLHEFGLAHGGTVDLAQPPADDRQALIAQLIALLIIERHAGAADFQAVDAVVE